LESLTTLGIIFNSGMRGLKDVSQRLQANCIIASHHPGTQEIFKPLFAQTPIFSEMMM